jgi:hypothetical protein
MKRRLLLLGVGVAALGAILASGAIANPTGTAVTGPSANVDIIDPTGSAQLVATDTDIYANNTAQKVADVQARNDDLGYTIEATNVAVTTQPSEQAGTCATPVGSISDFTNPTALTGSFTTIADLDFAIPSVGTLSDCVIGGAIVTVTFQVIDDPV